MKLKLLRWSKDPIHVPRAVLTAKYVAFMVLGVLSVIGGIPSLSLATFDTWTTYWSAGLVVSAAIATVTSFRRAWEYIEKWFALIIFGLLMSWAVAAIWRAAAEGDVSRVAGSFAVLVISFLPGIRAFGLMRDAGK